MGPGRQTRSACPGLSTVAMNTAVNFRIRSAWFAACALLAVGCGDHSSGNSAASSAALAGACIVNSLASFSLLNCQNLDAYSACATTMCGFQNCADACKDFKSCVGTASDPCTNSCVETTDCQSCLAPVAACSASQCLETLICGTVADGGACDELDSCCDALAGDLKTTCQLAARATRIGGDPSCKTLLLAPAIDDAGGTLFGCSR
jgi:hypothetical protein